MLTTELGLMRNFYQRIHVRLKIGQGQKYQVDVSFKWPWPVISPREIK